MRGRYLILTFLAGVASNLASPVSTEGARRPVELELEPGRHETRSEGEVNSPAASDVTTEGERLTLDQAEMKRTAEHRTRRRRSESAHEPYALEGRSRVEMRLGASDLHVSHNEWTDALDVAGGDFSLTLAHWPHEYFALDLTLGASNIDTSSRQTRAGETVRAETLYRVMAGGRFYLPIRGAFRPHARLAVGALTEVDVHDDPWRTEVSGRATKVGLEVGGGVDFLLGAHFVLGVHAGTIVREGYRGRLNVGCSLGWSFGGP